MSHGVSGAVRGAAHCARREKSRDKWGTGHRAAKARGAENGDAMRRKGAARGARRVMSEGVRGRGAALRARWTVDGAAHGAWRVISEDGAGNGGAVRRKRAARGRERAGNGHDAP